MPQRVFAAYIFQMFGILCICGFLGSLIMNLTFDFSNSMPLIQDGGRKFEKLSDYAENLYYKGLYNIYIYKFLNS